MNPIIPILIGVGTYKLYKYINKNEKIESPIDKYRKEVKEALDDLGDEMWKKCSDEIDKENKLNMENHQT